MAGVREHANDEQSRLSWTVWWMSNKITMIYITHRVASSNGGNVRWLQTPKVEGTLWKGKYIHRIHSRWFCTPIPSPSRSQPKRAPGVQKPVACRLPYASRGWPRSPPQAHVMTQDKMGLGTSGTSASSAKVVQFIATFPRLSGRTTSKLPAEHTSPVFTRHLRERKKKDNNKKNKEGMGTLVELAVT